MKLYPFSALTLLVGRQEGHPACKKTEWWGAGVVICLERWADLHMAQLMPLPLTVSCFSKIQIGFTFLVPAHPDSLGKRAVKRVCVCLYEVVLYCLFCRVADHDDQGLLLASRMMCYSASCIYPSHHVSVTQCQHRRTWEREHFGPAYVLKKAASREHWCLIVDTAMLKKSMLQGDTWV